MKKMLLEYFKKVKSNLIEDLEILKKGNNSFSSSLDEWTSKKNLYFFKICILERSSSVSGQVKIEWFHASKKSI